MRQAFDDESRSLLEHLMKIMHVLEIYLTPVTDQI